MAVEAFVSDSHQAHVAFRTDRADGPLDEIANAIVGLSKKQFGRGPTKARCFLAEPGVLVVLLQDGLTIAERNLVALGGGKLVHEERKVLQGSLEHEARAIVERVLERRTTAFISGFDVNRDLSLALFVLERPSAPAESRPSEPAATGPE